MTTVDSHSVILKACPRAEFVPAADRQTLAGIKCGIFFVMAFWSGSARKALAALARVLDQVDPQARVRLVVADTDQIDDLRDQPPFASNLGGWGETFWIKDGRIVADSGRGLNVECLEPFTRNLLAQCSE